MFRVKTCYNMFSQKPRPERAQFKTIHETNYLREICFRKHDALNGVDACALLRFAENAIPTCEKSRSTDADDAGARAAQVLPRHHRNAQRWETSPD